MTLLPFTELQRRGILPLAGLALAAFYFLVLLPIKRRSESLDAPLLKAWQRLAVSLDQTNANAVDFLHITNQLAETRQALAILENAKQKVTARLELGASVRAKMSAPFQLVDYENERSKQIDDLGKLAKQEQATVEPAVFAGFPEHTADVRQPELLWAGLSLASNLLTTALQCKVAAIHSLEVPMVLTNAPATNETPQLSEIPLQLELTGPAGSVAKLLQSLPLRGEELRSAGQTQAPADKPALFIERFVIRKQSPEKPDEVRMWLRAVGFVLRE